MAFKQFAPLAFLMLAACSGPREDTLTYRAGPDAPAVTHTTTEWANLAATGDSQARRLSCLMMAGTAPDPRVFDKAVIWCQPLAAQGDVASARLLSEVYRMGGHGIEPDAAEAYYWERLATPPGSATLAVQDAAQLALPAQDYARIEGRVISWRARFCAQPGLSPALFKAHCGI